jgi:hypothetical protein
VKVGIDESGRHQATFGIDFLVHRVRVFFADKLDTIAVINNHTVLDYFMFFAVEADDPAALNERFHCTCLSELGVETTGRTNK